jgi:GT2 family glycosyltransferase
MTAIVILNYKGAHDTIICLRSVLMLCNDELKVFVVDNNSNDGSIDIIKQWCDVNLPNANQMRRLLTLSEFRLGDLSKTYDGNRIYFVENTVNGGYAAGNNIGIRAGLALGCENFLILNNDTEVDPNTLSSLRKRASEDPSIGICGATIVYSNNPTCIQTRAGATFNYWKGKGRSISGGVSISDPFNRAEIERKLRSVNGACMFVTKQFILDVGLMYEGYFLYWEELEWAERGRPKFKLGYAADALVRHKVGASIGTSDFGRPSLLSLYYLERNRIWFCAKSSKLSLPYTLVEVSLNVIKWLIRGDVRRAAVVARALFGLTPKF